MTTSRAVANRTDHPDNSGANLYAYARRGAHLPVARDFECAHKFGGALRLVASSAFSQGSLRGDSYPAQRRDCLQ